MTKPLLTAKPFSYKTLTRILVILVVVLSIAAGYFESMWIAEQKKYLKLEDKYVRVRSGLGTEEAQTIIDESQQENN